MKIQLAPGQRLVIGFYIPANQQEDRGWRAPEDQPLDGEFVIEYGEKGITVSADLPDDIGRGGHEELNDRAKSGVAPVSPIIYSASFGDVFDQDDVDAQEAADEQE